MTKYIIISPVRNEELLVEKTLQSVINQTLRPVEWIMVNDGSTDHTEEIIRSYQQNNPWIKLINLEDRGFYLPGKGVVETFYKGYDSISVPDWQYVVKLDTDLTFSPDYFETVFKRFNEDQKLGIASGCTYLPVDGKLIREPTQPDHPVGPSKIYKRECWEQINGLKPIPGWDLADLLAAQMNGWTTACFFDLKLTHHRLTGSRRKGYWGPNHLQGRFEYRHGYSFFYTLTKSAYHLFSKPVIIGSIAKVTGYLSAFFNKEEYLFEKDMRIFLRNKHKQNLLGKFSNKHN